jgi:predicted nuclease with TOPRIM domain
MKDLCEQQEVLTTQVGALKEIYEYRLTKVEQEVKNAMTKIVSEVGVKYSLLNENQEKLWKEFLEKGIEMREVLGQSQRGVQEDFLKQSDQLLQLEQKFSLLEETMKHTKDKVDQIFSFILLQQTNT